MKNQHDWWKRVQLILVDRKKSWLWLAEKLGWKYGKLNGSRRHEPGFEVIGELAAALDLRPCDLCDYKEEA